ncbi:MAG: glycoprotein [hymenopteran phasma-related virus OKIAV228]|uniref:glycoprotein n=1 Tax=hymenopteran phasma-related virus OKIAV228 TaxID=2847800 RepID=UPI0024840190|nr:MAG: glycoprotein [hymenopteran phasma-related virus OKIAV228]WBM84620.1 MAG: glycoprotein [hymenopteran phasma-related virus OKIAV228]
MGKKALTLIGFLLIMALVESVDIQAHNGIIEIAQGVKCTIKVNNTVIVNNTDDVKGFHYGLLEYNCNNTTGFILSKPKCFDCGLYCPQNDMILECRQFLIPYVFGVITSLLLFIAGVLILKYASLPLIKKLKNKLIAKKENKRNKKIDTIIKRIKIDQNTAKEGEYLELVDAPEEKQPSAPVYEPRRSPTRTRTLYPTLAAASLSILSGVDRTFACDRTLFMHTNGKICDQNSCQDINSYTFNLMTGSTVCFTTPERNTMKFDIESSKLITKYNLEYYTSDIDIGVESYSECKQTGDCFKEYCHLGSRYSKFNNKTGLNIYDCHSEGLGCDTWCWHKYACTWIHVNVFQKGVKSPVYKRLYKIWNIRIRVSYKDIIRYYEFDTNNPFKDLDIGKLFTDSNFPISINNVMHADLHTEPYIIMRNMSYYAVNANELNFPSVHKLGDFQIDLEGNFKYPTDALDCRTSGCNTHCNYPEPALRTLDKTVGDHDKKEFYLSDTYSGFLKNTVPVTVSISVGNIKFKNLYVEQAMCSINAIYTFGCIGCNLNPYAVLQATSIRTPGIVQYESNCTFDQHYLSCNEGPFIINPIKNYDICNIFISKFNQSFDINFKYKFTGKLSAYDTRDVQGMSFGVVAKSILENPNFLDSLSKSFMLFSGIGVLASVTLRIVNRILAAKVVTSNKENI